MMWSESSASSRAVTFCCGSPMPVALRKTDLVRPSARTRSVISRAKVASSPATASASAIEASLPDWTMMPCRMSESFTRLFSMREHGRAAGDAAALAPGVLGDADLAVERQPPLGDFLERDESGRDLGHARRRHQLVGGLLVKHRAAGGIEQDGVGAPATGSSAPAQAAPKAQPRTPRAMPKQTASASSVAGLASGHGWQRSCPDLKQSGARAVKPRMRQFRASGCRGCGVRSRLNGCALAKRCVGRKLGGGEQARDVRPPRRCDGPRKQNRGPGAWRSCRDRRGGLAAAERRARERPPAKMSRPAWPRRASPARSCAAAMRKPARPAARRQAPRAAGSGRRVVQIGAARARRGDRCRACDHRRRARAGDRGRLAVRPQRREQELVVRACERGLAEIFELDPGGAEMAEGERIGRAAARHP